MFIGLLVVTVLGLFGLIWKGVVNDRVDTSYNKTLTVPAKAIKTINLAGLEQPVEVMVTD